MTTELVSPDNVSKELLKACYDAAFMSTSFDKDGDLKVSDGGYFCFVFPSDKTIRLMTVFGTNPGASRQQLVDFANRVNEEYILVRAAISKNSAAVFDYYFYLDGELTQRSIVTATKRMLQVTAQAVKEYGGGILA